MYKENWKIQWQMVGFQRHTLAMENIGDIFGCCFSFFFLKSNLNNNHEHADL